MKTRACKSNPKNTLKWCLELWLDGEIISYFSFFTAILIECVYLFAFHPPAAASSMCYTLLIYAIVMLLTTTIIHRLIGGYSWMVPTAYIFIVLRAVAKINIDSIGLYLALIFIPLIFTLVSCKLKSYQLFTFRDNFFLWFLIQAFIIGLPIVLLGIFLSHIQGIPNVIEIGLPIICLICSPFVMTLECFISRADIIEVFDVFGIFD